MKDKDNENTILNKNEVQRFLSALNWRLSSPDFDPEWDLNILRIKGKSSNEYSNINTLLNLEFSNFDVCYTLKELKLSEYSHSVKDIIDDKPPALHVFGKVINNRLVYIKIKMKEYPDKNVVCVSFHYARRELTFPYTE